MLPRSFVVLGPIQKRALTKLIVCRVGIADKLCKEHRSELLAILALKHVTPSGAHARKLLHAYVDSGKERTCEPAHASACNCLRLLA